MRSKRIQDGGADIYTVPPRATERTTTNLKTKTNQNHQKIKLYRSLTTEELQKKHSSRLVGGAEMSSQDGEDSWQGGGWRTRWAKWQLVEWAVPPVCADKLGGSTGEQDRPHDPGF